MTWNILTSAVMFKSQYTNKYREVSFILFFGEKVLASERWQRSSEARLKHVSHRILLIIDQLFHGDDLVYISFWDSSVSVSFEKCQSFSKITEPRYKCNAPTFNKWDVWLSRESILTKLFRRSIRLIYLIYNLLHKTVNQYPCVITLQQTLQVERIIIYFWREHLS